MTKLFFCIFIGISIFSIHATGIEHAKIEIKPLYISADNEIVCKTYIDIDPQDAGALTITKYGFLVFNDKGLWEETYYYSLETNVKTEKDYSEIYKLKELYDNNDFSQNIDYIKIYKNYKQQNEIEINSVNEVNLLEHNIDIYSRGYNENFKVKTLYGFYSFLESKNVDLYYQNNGIHMIRNIDSYVGKRKTGAKFNLPNYYMDSNGDVKNLSYSYEIDGILIFKKY